MGWVAGKRNLLFYADKRRIGGRDHIWVQDAVMVSIAMFRRMGLETNLEKSKSLVYNPSYNWGKWSEGGYKRRYIGEGGNLQGEESGEGELHNMWSDSGGVIPEKTHGEATWKESAADEGGGDKGGRGGFLCGFLPPGAQYGEMPSSGMSGSSAYCGPDESTFFTGISLLV